MVESQLDFGLLGRPGNLQTADYRSAGSHQAENLQMELISVNNTWEEIYVVPIDKTYYVSGLIIATEADGRVTSKIGIGASSSETEVLVVSVPPAVAAPCFVLALPTPIKFSAGTRISVRVSSATNNYFTLIGWTE